MKKQRGMSLWGLAVTLGLLGFFGLMAAKLLPSYIDYWNVRKMLAAMEKSGELSAPPGQIRHAYDIRNAISDVRAVNGKDLEINQQGGETVVSADWSVRVPLVANISACIDFSVSTGEVAQSSDASQQ